MYYMYKKHKTFQLVKYMLYKDLQVNNTCINPILMNKRIYTSNYYTNSYNSICTIVEITSIYKIFYKRHYLSIVLLSKLDLLIIL